ncbi:MAG: MFS transporter [Clostridiales bacterium]|nr:MFS transporter [Clostridiales bacterium]
MSFFLFNKKAKGEGYVANRSIFSYAVGLSGQNVSYSYVSGWLRYFCVNILKIDEMKVGTIFSLSYLWDAVNDPIIGAFIDRRTHKPMNKLRPYLLYLPPVIGALGALMFLRVPFGENGAIIYMLILYFVWDFFYSFQDVALWGMLSLSSPHSEERSRIAQWVSIGAGAGAALAGIFQMVRSMLTNPEGLALSDSTVFMIFGIAFGLGGELLSMRAHKMHELVEGGEPDESILKSLTILRHNPTLLLISLARFSQYCSPKVQNAYFFENCVTFMDGKKAEFLFGLLGGVPGALAIFFATKIADKVGGMKKLLIISQITAIIIRLITYFVGYNSLGQFVAMTALISLVNIPGSLMDIAHRSLTSDSIDEVELKTGIRSEGVSFSMQNFTTKLGTGASTFIEGVLLKRLGYDRFARDEGRFQSAAFCSKQWPMFMLGPVVGAVLYIIVISFVKDDSEHRDEVERQLKARRAALEKETILR